MSCKLSQEDEGPKDEDPETNEKNGRLYDKAGKIRKMKHEQVPYQSCASGILIPDLNFLGYIPDPKFFHPGPNFFHPGSRIGIKEFKYFNPKNCLSSRKYDPGCSSWILIFYPSPIPDPWVKKAPDPGSGSATLSVTVPNLLFSAFRIICVSAYFNLPCYSK
jgi:hypothetical protein